MSTKNTFKYVCSDCGAATWLSARQRLRRAIPRCGACGSTRLDPSRCSDAKVRLRLAEKEHGRQKRKRMSDQNF